MKKFLVKWYVHIFIDENGDRVGFNEDDDNIGDNEDQQNKKAKAKKKRVKKSAQIIENLETINTKTRDEFTDVNIK